MKRYSPYPVDRTAPSHWDVRRNDTDHTFSPNTPLYNSDQSGICIRA